MSEPCAQCRIEIAAGERTEPDPECFACGDRDIWTNTRTGERFTVTAVPGRRWSLPARPTAENLAPKPYPGATSR